MIVAVTGEKGQWIVLLFIAENAKDGERFFQPSSQVSRLDLRRFINQALRSHRFDTCIFMFFECCQTIHRHPRTNGIFVTGLQKELRRENRMALEVDIFDAENLTESMEPTFRPHREIGRIEQLAREEDDRESMGRGVFTTTCDILVVEHDCHSI